MKMIMIYSSMIRVFLFCLLSVVWIVLRFMMEKFVVIVVFFMSVIRMFIIGGMIECVVCGSIM